MSLQLETVSSSLDYLLETPGSVSDLLPEMPDSLPTSSTIASRSTSPTSNSSSTSLSTTPTSRCTSTDWESSDDDLDEDEEDEDEDESSVLIYIGPSPAVAFSPLSPEEDLLAPGIFRATDFNTSPVADTSPPPDWLWIPVQMINPDLARELLEATAEMEPDGTTPYSA